MYVQKGSVKLTVVNESGKEAVVALFGPGDFFGEGGMAGQAIRMGTATAVVPTTVLMIEKTEMIRALHAEPALSDRFIKYILSRNIRVEADLSTSFSTQRRSAWRELYCCWLATAKRTNPSECCKRYRRRPLRK